MQTYRREDQRERLWKTEMDTNGKMLDAEEQIERGPIMRECYLKMGFKQTLRPEVNKI